MDEEKSFIVNGFRFEGAEEAKQAASEQAKIRKIEEKLDVKNPERIALIYQKAIENNVFKTIVGYEFLKRLQKYLKANGMENIKSIPIVVPKKIQEIDKIEYVKKNDNQDKINELQGKIKTYRYVIIVLLILIIAIFLISMTGSKPTILNYERTLQNKYATWEQELKDREETIRQKERELNIIIE